MMSTPTRSKGPDTGIRVRGGRVAQRVLWVAHSRHPGVQLVVSPLIPALRDCSEKHTVACLEHI